MQEGEPVAVIERKYAIQFHFTSKHDAKKFNKLPKEYSNKFVLNNNIDQDRNTYIRIAQIK